LFKKLRVDPGANDDLGAVYRIDGVDGVPCFVMYLPPARDEEVLYHEALHMAVALMDHFGVAVNAANDETLAHLQSHIVRQIDRAVYKRPPPVNRTKRKSEVE